MGCTHSLGSAEGDTRDAFDMLETELSNGLACFLLVAGVDGHRGACRETGLALALALGVRAGLCILHLSDFLVRLVREFLNAWVGHVDLCGVVRLSCAKLGLELPSSNLASMWAFI